MLATLLLPSPAWACSCQGASTARDGLSHAAAVFVGRVLSIESAPGSKSRWGTATLRVTFAVSRSWKGLSQDTISVITGLRNEFFFSAPQLKRDPLGRAVFGA